jgi:hypothetical protein
MNEHARQVFEHAFELLDDRDALRHDIERRALEVDNDEVDALLTRSNGTQLKYRTQEDALVTKPQRIAPDNRKFMQVAEVIGAEVAIIENELRREISELRAEIEALRKSNVTPMRGRNVA